MHKFKPLFLVLIVAVSSAFLAGCTTSQPDMAEYNNIINSAKSSVQSKDYSEGLKTYISATDKFPSQIEGYKGIIQILLDKNLVSQAKDIADSAADRLSKPESAQLYLLVGDKYYSVYDYTNAQEVYKKALDADAGNSRVKLANARVYSKFGQVDNAARIADIGDDSSDEYFESQIIKTICFLTDIDKAKAELTKVSNRKAVNGSLNQEYGWLNDALDKAKSKNGDQLYVSTLLGGAYINVGYPKVAIMVLEPLKDKMGEYWDGLYFLGRAYFDSADYDKSVSTLESALTVAPDSFELQIMLGRAYFATKNVDKAISAYDAGVALAGAEKKAVYLQDYFKILFTQGQYSKAIASLNTLETLGDSVWLRLAYLQVYYQTQAYDKMKVHLDALAKRTDLTTDENVEYYGRYIDYALETSDIALAEKLLGEMQKVDTFAALYQYENGKYLFQTGKTDDAKKALENAVEYDLGGAISENAQKLLAKIE